MRLARSWSVFAALAVVSLCLPLMGTAQVRWGPVADGYPRTAAELNGFSAHTRHLEMWDYLEELRGLSPDMRLGSYGETREGRSLPYAIFGRPLVSEPWEAMALGRPIVLLAANVHGGERTFREGLLVLMRDLATPGTAANALLDRVTILVAPQINPDGFEASVDGQRGNSWGIDLNRDYVKLEHPSIANYVGNLIGEWRPHLFVDGHNGGARPYNLNYQCSSHYDSAIELTLICDNEIFPAINAKLATEGMKGWYYQGGNAEEWNTGGWQVRIGRNYGGIVNSVGILFEAPQQSLEVGARAGYLGYLAVVEYVVENATQLMNTIRAARAETIAMGAAPSGQVAVEMEYGAEDYLVDYELVTGGGFNDAPGTRLDTVQVTGARLMKKPVATKFRDRPWAYLLPRDAEDAVAMLLRHGITVERLLEPATLQVQAYTVGGVSHERQYNHAAVTRIQVGEVLTRTENFPVGTYVVPTAQSLGRLVAHMLEVETEDNVVYWNTMDAWIPRTGAPQGGGRGGFGGRAGGAGGGRGAAQPPLVPIFKLMTPTVLASHLVEPSR
ncbi:MAG: M14 family zinc carboxypeptidase [Gemmatimonadetes bacterium]|nr:M14 family zinc carboxypeptidase [Gemmatimonadota bacterium]MDA1104825.1 M14 family zinc carboxypeptidase [Gemmatimonadota bacterium]